MVGERFRVILALTDAFEGAAVFDGLLADGFEPVWRSTVHDVADEMRSQPFDLLIADASLAASGDFQGEGRARNPLTPVILIGDEGLHEVNASGRSMYLPRPADRAKVACFVAMALHKDTPVRRSARKRVDPIQAVIDTVPAHIVDVSKEGLRMEMPADRRSPLPPFFSVRVPGANLSLTVQRRWTLPVSRDARSVWYGGALFQNRAVVEEGWRRFVDSVPVVGDGE